MDEYQHLQGLRPKSRKKANAEYHLGKGARAAESLQSRGKQMGLRFQYGHPVG